MLILNVSSAHVVTRVARKTTLKCAALRRPPAIASGGHSEWQGEGQRIFRLAEGRGAIAHGASDPEHLACPELRMRSLRLLISSRHRQVEPAAAASAGTRAAIGSFSPVGGNDPSQSDVERLRCVSGVRLANVGKVLCGCGVGHSVGTPRGTPGVHLRRPFVTTCHEVGAWKGAWTSKVPDFDTPVATQAPGWAARLVSSEMATASELRSQVDSRKIPGDERS